MEKITLVVMIKEKEEGLLSIAEGRNKSMIPILGDARLIDYYLYPARINNQFKIFINVKSDDVEIKDYINFHYKDYSVKPFTGDNLFDNLSKIIRRAKTDMLIVQADGFIYWDWRSLINELLDIKGGNRLIYADSNYDNFRGLYISEIESFYDLLRSGLESRDIEYQDYDAVWERLISLSDNAYLKAKVKSIEEYFGLKTVREYYDFHMNLLDDMEKCYRYASLFYNEELKEKDDITVTSAGTVKGSYISPSSYIEGEIDSSFIFSNVKISKGAYIYRSIIMDNNSIAENAGLESVILCDGGELLQTVLPRVGENAILGGRSKNGYNRNYPEYIFGGISLVGSNVDIPRGFTMAENCYIPSNTGKILLKEKKKLVNGESLTS